MPFIKKHILSLVIILATLVLLFTPLGFRLKVQVSKLLSTSAVMLRTGKEVPADAYDWKLQQHDGTVTVLKDHKNKVLFINFWATWCAPCVAELPSIQKLYNAYGERVEFFLVTEEKPDKVQNFLIKNNYQLPIYYNNTEKPDVFKSKTVPTTYIVDRKGKIVIAETGAANWNSEKTREMLEEFLNPR